MIRQEAILQSPLRILDRSIRGGLGRGHLGVIVAPAGVGKSACLVQLGLDALLRQRPVLHLAAGQSVEHVAARYDAHFDDLADRVRLAQRAGVREAVAGRRLIWSCQGAVGPAALDEALAAFAACRGAGPQAVLLDGFDWRAPGRAAALAALKASAARAGAELWVTALAPPPADCDPLADVVLFLEPRGRHARVTLAKDFDARPAADVSIVLEGGALRRLEDDAAPAAPEVDPADFTLLAAGSAGAEAAFGACAEAWGAGEVNYSFAARAAGGRRRGLTLLGDEQLREGEVCPAYLRATLHRTLPDSPELRRVLQAIWHQVRGAGEVFAVGSLLPDGTARGGTGWAVELARHWGKPVHLFDLSRRRWLRWEGRAWVPEVAPAITCARFAGAGTRALDDAGRAAIRGLFERTFGPEPGRCLI